MPNGNGNSTGVWKWVAGILLAILATGCSMLIREDYMHGRMEASIGANTSAIVESNAELGKVNEELSRSLNELNLLLRAHRIDWDSVGTRGRRNETND